MSTELSSPSVDVVRRAVGPVTDGKPALQFFCTEQTCLRYLRARAMDEGKATRMLTETLKWCEPKSVSCKLGTSVCCFVAVQLMKLSHNREVFE